jgi:predicted DCC family thiol-disulfide oxidoreductase YuxK
VSADKPTLIFDGKCGFCRIWINYWRQLTGDRVEYLPSEDAVDRFSQIPADAYAESVQLVRPDGTVVSGARAVFETLGQEKLYDVVASPAEFAYRFIAGRRNFFYHVTRFAFGSRIEPARFAATQWLFLRALAIIYAIAFGSLAFQVVDLFGEHGITPVIQFLSSLAGTGSAMRFLAAPSIFWFGADDNTLTAVCFAGVILAAMLFVTGFMSGKFERLILAVLFVLHLSLVSVGQDFLSFQWDMLLLEAGFLAIFIGGSRIVPWLFRWLTFRLFFLSGAVKLLSGDPNWRNFSALGFHWHTQPLPTVLAWYADKLPPGFQHFATAATLGVELVIPFLIFFPRRWRIVGAWWLIGLEILILATGNYTYFNCLAMALCLFLFDDRALLRFVPRQNRESLSRPSPGSALTWAVAAFLVSLSAIHMIESFRGSLPAPLPALLRYTAPLRIVNDYGLFAVMTTRRNEIVLEGSSDGETWTPYEFQYKPGNIAQAPRWVAPYQPRLDWQMWFAALGNYQSNPWFVNFVVRLLQGSDEAAGLLAYNPFPTAPPRFIRATLYEYTFTDASTRARTGAWWKREQKGLYFPPVSLRGAVPQ